MDTDEKPSEEKSPTSESVDALTSRELCLLRHYLDSTSPGYHNGTRSAELAGYKDAPGSNQLAVQASRTLKKARDLSILPIILAEKGCTLEHLAECLTACLHAKRKPVFLTKAGQIVEGPEQDNHSVQIQAVKIGFQLHGAFDHARRQLPRAAACEDPQPLPEHQEQTSPEYQKAMAVLSKSDTVDRESLRDVLECDAKSAEFEGSELQSGTAEQSGQDVEGDPDKA